MSDLCREINKFGKGIGNEARYRILEALMKGPKTVGELVRIVGLSQPAVSQHLTTLKACDLVEDERRGQEVVYSANSAHTLKLLAGLIQNLQKAQRVANENKKSKHLKIK